MKTQLEKEADRLRENGRTSFSNLVNLFPLPFNLKQDVRRTVETLEVLPPPLGATAEAPTAPWRFGRVTKEANALDLEYDADPKWVEYYLGFLEALVEYCNQTAFILVRALRNELHFKVVFA